MAAWSSLFVFENAIDSMGCRGGRGNEKYGRWKIEYGRWGFDGSDLGEWLGLGLSDVFPIEKRPKLLSKLKQFPTREVNWLS